MLLILVRGPVSDVWHVNECSFTYKIIKPGYRQCTQLSSSEGHFSRDIILDDSLLR